MTQNNYKYGAATTLDIVDAQTALSVAQKQPAARAARLLGGPRESALDSRAKPVGVRT